MTTKTTSPAPRSQVLETQEAQHTTIRGLVAELLKATSVDTVRSLLNQMATVLPVHFDHEEAEDGVFSGLLDSDPTLTADVNRFVAEHLTFMEQLAELRHVIDRDPALAVAHAHDLGQALAAHEHAENELMMNALYDEVGEHD